MESYPSLTNLTLNEARRQKKQVALDVKALENRINLLEKEESKARKRILQTKHRALEILKLRKEHERRRSISSLTDTSQSEQSKIAQKRYVEKQLARAARKKKREQLENKKRGDAKLFRIQKRKQQEEMAKEKDRQRDYVCKMRKNVQKQRIEAQMNHHKHVNDMRLKQQMDYFRRIEQEKLEAEKLEKIATKLEKREMKLIEKLQTTQHLQKEAYSRLEDALTQSANKLSLTSSETKFGSRSQLSSNSTNTSNSTKIVPDTESKQMDGSLSDVEDLPGHLDSLIVE